MEISTLDLYRYDDVREYASKMEFSGMSIGEISEELASFGSSIALYRAANLAAREKVKYENKIMSWLKKAYIYGDKYVRLLVLTETITLGIRFDAIDNSKKLSIPDDAIKTMHNFLDDIEDENGHPLKIELEMKILQVIVNSYASLGKFAEAEAVSLKLIAISQLFKGNSITTAFMLKRGDIIAMNGEWSKSIDILLEAQSADFSGDIKNRRTFDMKMHANLLNLGDFEQSLIYLQDAISISGERINLTGHRQWLESLYGYLSPNEKIVSLSRLYDWQTLSMQEFARTDTLAPIGKQLSLRDSALRKVLDLSARSALGEIFDSDQIFAQWIRSRARLHLGEYGIAIQELAELPRPAGEDLFNRALISSIQLELAMTPNEKLSLPLIDAEAQFRKVFQDASSIQHASPGGLARLVQRWHPQVAVYAALMPSPIREFLPYLDTVVRVDARAIWKGQALPIPFLSHLTRLGLRLPVIGFTPSGNTAYQIARLGRQEQTHMGHRWDPIVPSLPIIVALMRGGALHWDAARRAVQNFGILPPNQTVDLALGEAVHTWRAVVNGEQPLSDGLKALQEL